MSLAIRAARPGDAPLIHAFVRELAAYERLLDEVEAGEADIAGLLFGPAAAIPGGRPCAGPGTAPPTGR
jgi:hypothetical protein